MERKTTHTSLIAFRTCSLDSLLIFSSIFCVSGKLVVVAFAVGVGVGGEGAEA